MKFAVAAVILTENNLTIEIVDAENWLEALSKHSMFTENGKPGDVSWLSSDMTDAKFDATNADILFDIKEL